VLLGRSRIGDLVGPDVARFLFSMAIEFPNEFAEHRREPLLIVPPCDCRGVAISSRQIGCRRRTFIGLRGWARRPVVIEERGSLAHAARLHDGHHNVKIAKLYAAPCAVAQSHRFLL
jgi:hypothetical protein